MVLSITMSSKGIPARWCKHLFLLIKSSEFYSQFKKTISYPAGFVYIYSLFYAVTNKGVNILLGQLIFVAIYMLFISTVFFIYKKTKRVC